jgi:hypothetical protein
MSARVRDPSDGIGGTRGKRFTPISLPLEITLETEHDGSRTGRG